MLKQIYLISEGESLAMCEVSAQNFEILPIDLLSFDKQKCTEKTMMAEFDRIA